jgi:tetratricopeptide (TPR) repeat protein
VLPLVVAAVAGLGFLSWLAWSSVGRRPDHWTEVELARRYLDQGRADLALKTVSVIRDRAPGAAEGLTIAARAFLSYGAVSDAKRALVLSLDMKPEQAEACKMLAAIYLASGDGKRGLELLEKAASLDPGDFRPHFAMGKVCHDLGDIKASADAYGRAMERNPPPGELKESRIGRARALLDSGQADVAAADLEALAATSADDPTVLALSARLARDQNRQDEALALAEKALDLDPGHFDARFVRAQVRNVRGETEAALEDLERAVEINPNHVGALQLLRQIQTRLGQEEEAEETGKQIAASRERTEQMDRLTKEIYQRPEDPEPRYRMGQAALEGNMQTLAYQCFRAALDLDPSYKPAQEALAAMAPPAGAAPGGSPATPHAGHRH